MRIINTKKSEKKIKKLPQPVLERIDTAQSISVLGALGNLLDLFEFCLFDYFLIFIVSHVCEMRKKNIFRFCHQKFSLFSFRFHLFKRAFNKFTFFRIYQIIQKGTNFCYYWCVECWFRSFQ